MQRVLLFTNNWQLAVRLAKTTGESERIEQVNEFTKLFSARLAKATGESERNGK